MAVAPVALVVVFASLARPSLETAWTAAVGTAVAVVGH